MKKIGMGGGAFKILLCRFVTAETEEVNLIRQKSSPMKMKKNHSASAILHHRVSAKYENVILS